MTALRIPVLIALVLHLGAFGSATAQGTEHPQARVASIDANLFLLDPGGHGVLSLGTDEVLSHLAFRGAATLHVLYRPIGVADGVEGDWKASLVEHREQVNVSGAMGIGDNIEAGLVLPIIAYQQARFPVPSTGEPSSTAMGDLRVHFKMRVDKLENEDDYGLAFYLPVILPTGDSNAWAGTGRLAAEPSVVVTQFLGKVKTTYAASMRLQGTTDIFGERDQSRVMIGAGGTYSLPSTLDRVFANGEAKFGTPVMEPFGNLEEFVGEWAGGVGYKFTPQLQGLMGIGTGIGSGFSTPLARGFISLSYTQGLLEDAPDCPYPESYRFDPRCPPPDSDGDNYNDVVDQCVDEPEDFDKFEDEDGCPDYDNDEDGFVDTEDQCPREAEDRDGFEDDDGCPDKDNDKDGIEDDDDQCPDDTETFNGVSDEDGCPEDDKDLDGITDLDDQCPEAPEDKDGFEDDDGCPDTDNDQDGIVDADDLCPMRPETKNGNKDEDGCPDEVLAVKTKEEIVITEEIHFLLGQTVPKRKSKRILKAIVKVLRQNPNIHIQVEGHTDALGGEDFNYYLSQARAQAIRDMLVRMGREEDRFDTRLTVAGVGSDTPNASNKRRAGRAKNRRVAFRIIRQ